ncbi:MAG: hypothetical protein IJ588_00710 [Prevotella sp.]|nr:hypothetical protein [Prevotella sp.]
MSTTIHLEHDKPSDEVVGKKTHLAHFWWVICLLLLIIVILAALLCTNIQMFEHRIMTFLSFTATLLSIVLSIFAIMYSFYSMKESSQQWNAVKTAVKSIEAYTDILSKSTQQLVEQVIKINRDLGSMQGMMGASNEIPKKDNPGSIENVISNTQSQARRTAFFSDRRSLQNKD